MSVNSSDSGNFSFGLTELAQADTRSAEPRAVSTARTPAKPAKPRSSGFDPYNSTGGFDRNKAWSRVNKR